MREARNQRAIFILVALRRDRTANYRAFLFMPMDTEENETKYILEDIQPETIGLVPFGANGETFFLLKSQEEQMDNYTIEEVPATDSPSDAPNFWQKVKTYIDSYLAKADEEAGNRDKEASVSKAVVQDYSALEAIQKAHLKAIEETHRAQIENLHKSMEEKYEGKIASLVERVEKAEQDKELAKFIEKAGQTYRALPLSAREVGGLLHKLSKGLDEGTFGEVESLLKSLDQQAFTAGLFGEIGTSRSPEEEALEDKVAKSASEGKDPAQALLSLSTEDQRKLLAEERARVGGRR